MKKAILSILFSICASTLVAGDLSNKAEASFFAGGLKINNGGNHGIYGANIGFGISPKATIYGEISHAPLNGGADLVDFNGGVKFTLLSKDKWEPYVLVGVGGNRVAGNSDFGFHFGGGSRYFVGKNWGVQPEIRWTRYFHNGSDTNAIRYTGGLFFQWGR
ncbi:MAG: hypothetical protein ABIR70_05420 [Bryobacteraceae bacterium]